MNWDGKKVLITGGAGMIGSHLAKRLVSYGSEVVVADDLSAGSMRNLKEIMPYIHFLEADLRKPEVADVLTKNKDVVFCLGADMGGITYIVSVLTQIMLNNTRINQNTLEACHKNNVPSVYFSSSACVYANYKQEDEIVALREEDAYPADPNEPYGWEKLYNEILCDCMMKDYGMDIKIGRFHNVYGEAYNAFDEVRAKAPCKMILRAIRHPKETIEIWNDGNQTRSFLYIDDCIDAIVKLMESDWNKPINIGSDRLISMNELAKLVIDISGKDIKPVYYPDKPQGVRGRNSNNELVEKVLGWKPRVTLEEGLKRVYQWGVEHYDELEGI